MTSSLILILIYICTVGRNDVQSEQEVPDTDENSTLLGIDMFLSSQQQLPISGMYCTSLLQTILLE